MKPSEDQEIEVVKRMIPSPWHLFQKEFKETECIINFCFNCVLKIG